jgi:hypothetical protein
MRKLIVSVVTAGALLAPLAALADNAAPTASSVAAQLCKQQQVTMGTVNFNAAYGTNASKSNAYGKCVAKNASLAQADVSNAAKACKTEQADAGFAAGHGGKTFAQFYGSGNGKGAAADANAYGKCVSAKAKAATNAQAAKAGSAAKACRAALKADATAFHGTYGTGASAFGKCVSAKSKAK